MKCCVHFLPAKSGDCLVLEFDNKNCILIDCGYPVTYEEELKPLLRSLAEKGCRISLMVITHIDEDHISGAVSFLEENGDAEKPRIIPVDEIWHNGIFNTVMKSELFSKHRSEEISEDLQNEYRTVRSMLKRQLHGGNGTVSALQSKMLENVCAKYHYRVNGGLDGGCIVKNRIYSFDGCEIRVLSPGTEELEKLQKALDRELVRAFGMDYRWNRPEEFAELLELFALCRGTDAPGTFTGKQIAVRRGDIQDWIGTSRLAKMNEINCASIVMEIRYEGLKLLFMGDSESELWAEQLEPFYDLIKVSHHGTTKPNLAWMERTDARRLLISTNGGKHRHPEDDFLARAMLGIFEELYFNYNIQRKSEILSMQETYHFKAEFEQREIFLNGVEGTDEEHEGTNNQNKVLSGR